jgi:hypothetical protein
VLAKLSWNKYEDFSYREALEAGIFSRYVTITEHQKEDELREKLERRTSTWDPPHVAPIDTGPS